MAKNFIYLYGKNPVYERIKANPKTVRKIFFEEDYKIPFNIKLAIEKSGIATEFLPKKDLFRLKNSKDLQGVIAKADKFNYALFEDLLNQPQDKQLTLIFLDKINDPQNLGVIIRTAACFGGFAVIIPKFKACEVTEAVLHVASGGENYVPVAMVSNITYAIITAKKAGYWIMGTLVDEEAEDISKISLPFPLGLVLGSEGEGVSHGLKKHFDIKAHIPMDGVKLSFNVSMACAIFCHEITKQRKD
ncbi:MAG: 23S rRNA (guanosine(2251)-2'-O)-methyltransferase RlmB [Candidatus Omnitrophota bacterium]|nr:MAG: 23S rRNA (guanosine(2251)-2'-O)-methyltransferase RlmB [Candidatus Omnitrophota bacterium]